MTVYLPQTSENTTIVIGEIYIIDPDVQENFIIILNKPTLRAITPASNSYSILLDDDSVVYVRTFSISRN